MLADLHIRNIAIIDELRLSFPPGFIVLTGETGAGKSIVIDAIGLLIGTRASSDQIRAGATEALIEGVFDIQHLPEVTDRLKALDLIGTAENAGELIIQRTLSTSGRHRIRINGILASISTLQHIGESLVDIHGQHDTQSLFRPAAQLDLLDAFGNLLNDRVAYQQTHQEVKRVSGELEAVEKTLKAVQEQADRLEFERQDIESAAVQPGEDVALEQERQIISHAHRLAQLSTDLYSALYEDDLSALSQIGRLGTLLQELVRIDQSLADMTDLLHGATAQLKELARRIKDYQDQLNADPGRLDHIEDRLDRLNRLKKRYGGSLEHVIGHLEQVRRDLDGLMLGDERKAVVGKVLAELRAQERTQADHLSTRRVETAQTLAQRVIKEMTDLHMPHAAFRVRVERNEDGSLTSKGLDSVQFLFSGVPGEPPRSLKDAISGGELSRVTLCIKTVLAREDRIPVLIFDEIDAGIGGAVAERVGKKLRMLGQQHQVFCVTHLPQIAALGTAHFSVEKVVKHQRASTRVRQISDKERIQELARMLGGTTITAAVQRTAKEMLAQ